MIEYYPEIRSVHIAAVFASGGLFLLRGLLHFAGIRWAMARPIAYLTYVVDTVLLTAALMLMTIVQQYPFVHGWVTVKVLLLVVYVALDIAAFRKGGRKTVRIGCWVTALLVYGFIVSVARAHHPLGIFSDLVGAH